MKTLELPALHDHHSHVSLYTALEGLPDLSSLGPKEALDLLSSQGREGLGIVKGWRSERLPLDAEQVSGLPPLVIVNFSLHGFVLTPAALPFIRELWPDFLEHQGDEAWAERSLPELFAFYCRLGGFDQVKLAAFMARMEALGIYSMEDMASPGGPALDLLEASPYASRVASWIPASIYLGLAEKDKRRAAGVKLFLDGSIGARSAAIDRPYLGGGMGRLTYGEAELEELLLRLATASPGPGPALSIHAIGQRAIEEALSALEALGRRGFAFPLVRLEHLQFMSLAQARRAKELGLILSMQPNFNSDSVDYRDRLSPELLAANDPFRMLIDEAGFLPGRDLIFGSDGMPHGPEYALQWSLFPAFPGQRLELGEFLAGYSLEGDQGESRPDSFKPAIISIDEARGRVYTGDHGYTLHI
jgi:hypothetical protein